MKKVRYNGFSFPIDLKGVKTREFRGEILPDINHRELEDLVFKTPKNSRNESSLANISLQGNPLHQSAKEDDEIGAAADRVGRVAVGK